MKIKVSEASGVQLDWLIAQLTGVQHSSHASSVHYYSPTRVWAQGGPIIEREFIQISPEVGKHGADNAWWAIALTPFKTYGPTPLIAAMRCFICSRLGDLVEIPYELN